MTESGTFGIGGVVAEKVKTLEVTLGRSTHAGKRLGSLQIWLGWVTGDRALYFKNPNQTKYDQL
ncbi:hypothetical protein DPMN_112654 [Dreissena polymorpha]|uniref:Uncharacterized protein n=1 Tax=Dreissena polymorpha TaxID=45954 RepID=A0A9D4KGT7_DREPO|nr:hypothetical protein DPMN_112654 [Dreissena polymorpha]